MSLLHIKYWKQETCRQRQTDFIQYTRLDKTMMTDWKENISVVILRRIKSTISFEFLEFLCQKREGGRQRGKKVSVRDRQDGRPDFRHYYPQCSSTKLYHRNRSSQQETWTDESSSFGSNGRRNCGVIHQHSDANNQGEFILTSLVESF